MALIDRIQALSGEIFTETVSLRRTLHENPELAFEEHQTAALVCARLKSLGIEYLPNIAKTGVVGYIRGGKPGKTIALRADMDALPILEAEDRPYASKNPGVMHACGHDVHTASLLGTAEILQKLAPEISGTIKLIFQPSEEKNPGGASVMIKEGVLENPKVESILGQHVMPYLDAGKIGIRPGRYMASNDEIYLTIKGKGGHGAHPHLTIDPIVIAAQVITALQTVVSRNADPRKPSVLTFGKLIANGATNVIPDEVRMEGTFRAFDESWRKQAHEIIRSIITNVVAGMGATADLVIDPGYPVLFNDEALTGRTANAITTYAGKDNLVELDMWMAAEDFAWYTHQVPGCFYRLGTRNEARGIIHGLHTSRFDIDEDALRLSTGLMAWLAVKELGQ